MTETTALLPVVQQIVSAHLAQRQSGALSHLNSLQVASQLALAVQQATAEKCAELIRAERDDHDAGTGPWCALSQALIVVKGAFGLET